MVTQEQWQKDQAWELAWHKERGNCANSYYEETKQYDYAGRMGLNAFKTDLYGAVGWDFGNKTVLDVGGGAYSLLLKSKAKRRVVLDPCDYPNWTKVRYKECGIEFIQQPAETMEFPEPFDIILCYNVLQHVKDPEAICKQMRKYSKLIYFFDWAEVGASPGHPHNLFAKDMDRWLGGEGKSTPAVRGFFYSGIFKGDYYEESLVDSTHTIEINAKLWQDHNFFEGEWSPNKKWEQDLIGHFVNKYAKNKETILEIGVGNGRWTDYLQKIATKLIGVDLVDKAIQMCSKKFVDCKNVSLYKNDGKSLPFVDPDTVDFIWSFDTFVHISPHDVSEYLKEFQRVMKKGAVGIIHHGRSGDREGWRSSLTNGMFDKFLADNKLTLLDRVESWGKNNEYKITHKDSISVFTK